MVMILDHLIVIGNTKKILYMANLFVKSTNPKQPIKGKLLGSIFKSILQNTFSKIVSKNIFENKNNYCFIYFLFFENICLIFSLKWFSFLKNSLKNTFENH